MSRQREVLEQKNANLRRTRDLLLPRLISGEVDVSGLDIDVPATAEA
jgi:type I restriction enzyme S subunit